MGSKVLARGIRLGRPRPIPIRVASCEEREKNERGIHSLEILRVADLCTVKSVCPPSSFPSNHPRDNININTIPCMCASSTQYAVRTYHAQSTSLNERLGPDESLSSLRYGDHFTPEKHTQTYSSAVPSYASCFNLVGLRGRRGSFRICLAGFSPVGGGGH